MPVTAIYYKNPTQKKCPCQKLGPQVPGPQGGRMVIIIIIISEFIIVKLRVETNQTLVFIR